MDFKGVAHMVDNCSTTARLGSRKWAPRFDYIMRQQTFTALDQGTQVDEEQFDKFVESDIHQVLGVCADLRPSVDISVMG
jgi:ketol-acid reductoisomerase